MDLQTQMKQAVAQAAVDQIQNGMILGLGSGSTAALMIEALAEKIKSGQIKDVVTPTISLISPDFIFTARASIIKAAVDPEPRPRIIPF